jgi:DNA-3-methyladenine glycosylase II
VEELFQKANVTGGTTTKGGWCLKEGMTHILETGASTRLLSLVQQKGLPRIYAIVEDATCRHEKETVSLVDQHPSDCFQALCRIIAGQQLAGAAAKSVWMRLRSTANPLTPESILMLVEKGLEEYLRKPAGLSNAKTRSIVALSDAFRSGELSEDFLSNSAVTEVELRAKLLAIKGIGPWTCDMFLMFHLEKKSVLPLGDLGVRKGIAKFFQLKGRGPRGTLCDKKDRDVMEDAIAPFSPYQSLVTYYMWAAADTKDLWGDPGTCNDDRKEILPLTTETPSTTGHSKRARRIVTP